MSESAAHLVDQVFPRKPLRQWVLSFPFQLKFLLAKDPKGLGINKLYNYTKIISKDLLCSSKKETFYETLCKGY